MIDSWKMESWRDRIGVFDLQLTKINLTFMYFCPPDSHSLSVMTVRQQEHYGNQS